MTHFSKDNKQIPTVITHDGVFHSDEIIAIAILIRNLGDIVVVRTRDKKLIGLAEYVVDVGGECSDKRFDHHQFNDKDTYYGLSSAGLVCKHFGMNNPEVLKLIEAVDYRDTRITQRPFNTPKTVSEEVYLKKYNPIFTAVAKCNNLNLSSPEQIEIFNELVLLFVEYINKEYDGDGITLNELLEAIEDLAEIELNRKEKIFKERMDSLITSVIDGVAYIHTGKYEYLPLEQLIGKVPKRFIFTSYDEFQENWTHTTDTEFLKITSIAPNKQKIMVHHNGFMAKSIDKDVDVGFEYAY